MSDHTNVPVRGVKGAGTFAILAGAVMVLAGVAVWILVATQLSAENIAVADDSEFLGGALAGQQVQGPLTAYAQADIINHHALEASGGSTYAELAQDDPVRDTMMNASFLRASLFTSVVSFGICALVVGLGIVLGVIGGALRRLGSVPAP